MVFFEVIKECSKQKKISLMKFYFSVCARSTYSCNYPERQRVVQYKGFDKFTEYLS